MGNSVSSSCSDVVLHLNDKSRTYTAGSTLSGEIRCRPPPPHHDHHRSSSLLSSGNISLPRRGMRGRMSLYFIGKEDVEVVSSSGSADDHRRTTTAVVVDERCTRKKKAKVAKHDIARYAITIDFSREDASSSSSSSSSSGMIIYPFTFHIPDNLPSSMYLEDENGGHCSVRYKLKMIPTNGCCERREMPITIISKSPRGGGTAYYPMPNREGGTQRIKFMRLVPRGNVSWHAGVYDDRVGIGENLIINLAINNDSSSRIERVSAVLEETAMWRASRRRSSCVFRTIDPHPSNFRLLTTDDNNNNIGRRRRRRRLAILSRGAKRTQQGTEEGGHATTTSSSLVECRRDNNNNNNDKKRVDMVLTFPIPEYVRQSYAGRLMTIRHRVRIDAKAQAYYTSPRMFVPIVVVSSPRRDDVPVVAVTATIIAPSAPPLEYEESAPSTKTTTAAAAAAVVEAPVRADETPTPPGSPPLRSVSDRECSINAASIAPSAAVVPGESRANEDDDEGSDVITDAAALESEGYDTTLDGLTIIPPPFLTTSIGGSS